MGLNVNSRQLMLDAIMNDQTLCDHGGDTLATPWVAEEIKRLGFPDVSDGGMSWTEYSQDRAEIMDIMEHGYMLAVSQYPAPTTTPSVWLVSTDQYGIESAHATEELANAAADQLEKLAAYRNITIKIAGMGVNQ